MRSLQVRLTVWFAVSFVAVAAVFAGLMYHHIEQQLSRTAFAREQNLNRDWVIRGSVSEQEIDQIMTTIVGSSLKFVLPLVFALLLLGYWLARKSLGPLETLNRQLASVGPRNLSLRVGLPAADSQFRDLTQRLNEMLERLERSFGEMGEYAAKVAHELRTPLTILRLKVEQSEGRIAPDLAEELQSELHRLTHVVEQSLLIAKADQGRLTINLACLDLAELAREVVEDFRLLAEYEGRTLRLRADRVCWAQADTRHARQVLHALLTNALTHGQGEIVVRVRARSGRAGVLLANAVRRGPRRGDSTLGLGLRVVRALIGLQSGTRFRQHTGSHWHASRIEWPAVSRTAIAVSSAADNSTPIHA